MHETQYTLAQSPSGVTTFVDQNTGEFLHRFYGPVKEAHEVYALGCRLPHHHGPLRVCDLGLGAGFNALAAIHAARRNPNCDHLHIDSLDLTLQGLEQLHRHLDSFPECQPLEQAILNMLQSSSHSSTSGVSQRQISFRLSGAPGSLDVSWRAIVGQAPHSFQALADPAHGGCKPYDAIFYDFFSCSSMEHLWVRQSLAAATRRLAPSGVLATFSAATPVRAALLSLGCTVGEGALVNKILRATLASPDPQQIENPLTPRWLLRFQRSQRPHLKSEPETERLLIKEKVMGHKQFQVASELTQLEAELSFARPGQRVHQKEFSKQN